MYTCVVSTEEDPYLVFLYLVYKYPVQKILIWAPLTPGDPEVSYAHLWVASTALTKPCSDPGLSPGHEGC